jgi:hypothetical protein
VCVCVCVCVCVDVICHSFSTGNITRIRKLNNNSPHLFYTFNCVTKGLESSLLLVWIVENDLGFPSPPLCTMFALPGPSTLPPVVCVAHHQAFLLVDCYKQPRFPIPFNIFLALLVALGLLVRNVLTSPPGRACYPSSIFRGLLQTASVAYPLNIIFYSSSPDHMAG